MQETVKLVIDALKPIAEKIGEGAAALFEIYTRQMWAEGVVGLATAALVLVMIAIIAVSLSKLLGKINDSMDRSFVAFFVILGIIGLTAGMIGLGAYSAMKAINPQYYAIERLLQQVKEGK